MPAFEQSLARRLKDAAEETRVPVRLEERVEALRLAPGRVRPAPRQLAAVAAAVALVAGTVVLVGEMANPSQRHHHSVLPPTRTRSSQGLTAQWRRIAPAPIPARSQYEAVWTGKAMIIWGGYDAKGNLNDGASYDPATDSWKVLPPAPLAARSGAVGVWTGSEMLVFGGSADVFYRDGAAYVPATNSWHRLAPIPASLGNLTGSGSYAVWTGRRMLVWGFFGEGGGAHGGGSLRAAEYDPATNTWTKGTAAPTQAPLFGDAFWTGSQMIVWGQRLVGDVSYLRHVGAVAAGARQAHASGSLDASFGISYDPSSGRWRYLPAAPIGAHPVGSMLAAWTGSELVVGGGELAHGLSREAAAYDPATHAWRRLPNAPVGFTGNADYPDVWTGEEVITFEDGIHASRPLMLDLRHETWRLGPAAPVPGRVEAEELWTGKEALVWGGGTARTFEAGSSCCTAVRAGYAFTPSPR